MEPLDPRRNVYGELEKFKQSEEGREPLISLVRQYINLRAWEVDAMTRADNTKKTLTVGFAFALPPAPHLPPQPAFEPMFIPISPRDSSASSEEL